MIGDFGFIHIEGQGLLQPETDHAFGLLVICGKRVKIEQHYADRGVGKHRYHITRAAAYSAQSVGNSFIDRAALAQVGLNQVWNHAARRQLMGCAFGYYVATIGNPAGEHTVRRNLAGQLGLGTGIQLRTHVRRGRSNQTLSRKEMQ